MMARFSCDGLDEFALSLQEIAEIPEDVQDDMLSSGASVGKIALKKAIQTLGLIDTGQLYASIQEFPKVDKDGFHYYLVYPYGRRQRAKKKGLAKVRIKGTKKYTIQKIDMTNNDVGFELEFGAPHRGVPAFQWMSVTAEEYADEITDAEYAIYDKWLESKNL